MGAYAVNPPLPSAGDDETVGDPAIRDNIVGVINLVNGGLDASNIANGAVTKEKLVYDPPESVVNTEESATSNTFSNLATPGPIVYINRPVTSTWLVCFSAVARAYQLACLPIIDFIVSGVTYRAPSSSTAVYASLKFAPPGLGSGFTEITTLTGFYPVTLNPGLNTIKLQYAVTPTGKLVSFFNRRLLLVPLGI